MQTYNPTAIEKGARTEFLLAVADEPNMVGMLATHIVTGANSEDYIWMGESPQMTEIVDAPRVTPMSDAKYTLTNSDYASIIGIKRKDIKGDINGAFQMRIRQLAQKAARHVNKLLIDALVDNGTGYDSVAMFSDSHTARGQQSAAQDNLLAGTGTTTAQVATDLNAAIAALLKFNDESGEPANETLTRFAVVYPPDIHKQMAEATGANIVSNTTNVQFAGMNIDLVPTGRLSDANDWYLLNTSDALRPLIFQERDPVSFHSLEDESDAGFFNEIWHYKARATYKVGYGPWWKAVKTTNT